ncbi:MAG: hypothetical protein AAGA15_00700 [Pseudomonadota bacterium]
MKHVTLAGELKEFMAAERLFVVHAEEGWLDDVSNGTFDFFTKLSPLLASKGVASVAVRLGSPLSEAMLNQAHIHVIFGNHPAYRPNVMHISPAYIWGFWYLDELGVNWNSSLRMRQFRPDGVDWGHAEWFFNGVASWMIGQNMSRTPQAEAAPHALDPARSVVFCQEIEDRPVREHYLTTEQMIINAGRAAGGGRVYVKPHPAQSAGMRARIDKIAERDPNVVVSEASIHDLIRVSDWVVTQNSAAGFEALLQKKKLITCARSDFHHASLVAKSEEDLRRILREGAAQFDGFQYEKYLYWFLSENCLEPQKEDFAERVWERLREKCMI